MGTWLDCWIPVQPQGITGRAQGGRRRGDNDPPHTCTHHLDDTSHVNAHCLAFTARWLFLRLSTCPGTMTFVFVQWLFSNKNLCTLKNEAYMLTCLSVSSISIKWRTCSCQALALALLNKFGAGISQHCWWRSLKDWRGRDGCGRCGDASSACYY